MTKTAISVKPRLNPSPDSGLPESSFRIGSDVPTNKLFSLGFQRGKDSILHTLFLSRPLLNQNTLLVTSEVTSVSGVCSYRYVRTTGSSTIYGVIWSTLRAKTVVTAYRLAVSQYGDSKTFTPVFDLEKLGLLYYRGSDSSVVVIPANIDFRLLVKATSGSNTID